MLAHRRWSVGNYNCKKSELIVSLQMSRKGLNMSIFGNRQRGIGFGGPAGVSPAELLVAL